MIHDPPLIYKFASVLDAEAFDALVTRMFSRNERDFRLWGHPIPMGAGKVHVYGCETWEWSPVTMEVDTEGVVALGPDDWYARLMDELSRAIPCRAAWIGKVPRDPDRARGSARHGVRVPRDGGSQCAGRMDALEDVRMIHCGDCLEVMKTMDADSVDAVVTDPPYGLSAGPASYIGDPNAKGGGFMGAKWDHGVPGPEFWAEALRVAKPGAHLVAFGGTRTFHRLACAIEDAGWELRDTLMFLHAQGFPKSLDVSKAIDKAAGHVRERIPGGCGTSGRIATVGLAPGEAISGEAISGEAAKWQGWGTALKPAFEPIVLARKPLGGRTVAANVLEHGTGGLNIDACRIGAEALPEQSAGQAKIGTFQRHDMVTAARIGRWPANLCHDGSDEVLAMFPETKGQIGGNNDPNGSLGYHGGAGGLSRPGTPDSGSAARFFLRAPIDDEDAEHARIHYTAKASRADREEGLDGFEAKPCGTMEDDAYPIKTGSGNLRDTRRANVHPTVKPTALMRWLCRLVTPPGGLILDPFTGSGSTGKAAILEGFRFVGIELDPEYVKIATARIAHAEREVDTAPDMFSPDMFAPAPVERTAPASSAQTDLFA